MPSIVVDALRRPQRLQSRQPAPVQTAGAHWPLPIATSGPRLPALCRRGASSSQDCCNRRGWRKHTAQLCARSCEKSLEDVRGCTLPTKQLVYLHAYLSLPLLAVASLIDKQTFGASATMERKRPDEPRPVAATERHASVAIEDSSCYSNRSPL